ncbi:MAG TPA: methylated-DNA--[protein]-cysteine S-methyltransferase [Phycisphaerales bacterium]|nr:methylated-DNA--[protein]-cysteine S-methyltransferase [Phycisphaerales bacterium]
MPTQYFHNTISTPIGELTTVVNEAAAVTLVHFGATTPLNSTHDPARTRDADNQFAEYFAGARRRFNLPLAPAGTDFQRAVWNALLQVPFGETRTYSQLAKMVGPTAVARAVGTANGANPIAIIIPCHRVIGADGTLTGYAGGLDMKRRLLELEGANAELFATSR